MGALHCQARLWNNEGRHFVGGSARSRFDFRGIRRSEERVLGVVVLAAKSRC